MTNPMNPNSKSVPPSHVTAEYIDGLSFALSRGSLSHLADDEKQQLWGKAWENYMGRPAAFLPQARLPTDHATLNQMKPGPVQYYDATQATLAQQVDDLRSENATLHLRVGTLRERIEEHRQEIRDLGRDKLEMAQRIPLLEGAIENLAATCALQKRTIEMLTQGNSEDSLLNPTSAGLTGTNPSVLIFDDLESPGKVVAVFGFCCGDDLPQKLSPDQTVQHADLTGFGPLKLEAIPEPEPPAPPTKSKPFPAHALETKDLNVVNFRSPGR